MKKSRPANRLSVLCNKNILSGIKEVIFNHSTSIGLIEYMLTKTVLDRQENEIETELGNVRFKSSFYKGREIHSKPEFDDLRKLANLHDISLSDAEKIINKNR